MSRIVHFEIPATNPDVSTKFYEDVFGWKFTRWGEQPYWMAETGPESEDGINGGLMKRNNPQQPVTIVVDVADIDKAIADIGTNGGEVVVPKTHMPGIGHTAYFKDPDGVILGVYQAESENL